jgi:hypothetical protein
MTQANQPQSSSATTADVVDPAIHGLFSIGWFDLDSGWVSVCRGCLARMLIGSRLLWGAGILCKGEGPIRNRHGSRCENNNYEDP